MNKRHIFARTAVVLTLSTAAVGLTAGAASARPIQEFATSSCSTQPHLVFEEDGSAYETTVTVCTIRSSTGTVTGTNYHYQNGDLEVCFRSKGKWQCSYID